MWYFFVHLSFPFGVLFFSESNFVTDEMGEGIRMQGSIQTIYLANQVWYVFSEKILIMVLFQFSYCFSLFLHR